MIKCVEHVFNVLVLLEDRHVENVPHEKITNLER